MLHLYIMTCVAKALIYNANGKILLLRRSNTHPHFALHLDFPGGEVESVESEFLAVSREILEETGIIVPRNSLHLVYQKQLPSGTIHMVFSAKIAEIKPKISLSWEHDQYVWLNIDELINKPLPLGVDNYYETALQYLVNMNSTLTIKPIIGIPLIEPGDDIADIVLDKIATNNLQLDNRDIICIASKILSISENCYQKLNSVKVSAKALELHKKIPRKDIRILQIILDQVAGDDKKIQITNNWIGAKNHIGRVLTSAGVDKVDDNTVLLLPKDPDASARKIAKKIKSRLNKNIGVLITDSDGREGIAGATQLCIGLYGVSPVRERNEVQETICDMLAAAAGLVMGQRGNNIPAVVIKGYHYEYNIAAKLEDSF